MSSDSLHFPCQVTTMVTRRIKPGFEDKYVDGLRDIVRVARGFEFYKC